MGIVLLACLAGGLGAVARAGVDQVVAGRWPAWVGTLLINVVGSFALGVASVSVGAAGLTVFGTGFCGGFTTFSSACWQAARELGRRRIAFGIGYAAVTVAACLTAALLGIALGGRL
ncbi:hypothetical protein BW730_17885 [Tessaracoccus aquimaris]|uniref:Fluoride-specific ion channel FluC n=1 Tax=Tessaracoccus aquimaris TaxID=1332264 RepID=A0A1Q2CSJ4_9ACTN|nr:CrcB family protein [Tessaracoccus aquimaris]AQP49082.1 hypothetical protein BW730_17885 [Tessaracoccus aquimaris]